MKFTMKKILSTCILMMLVVAFCVGSNIDYSSASTMPEYIKIGLKYGSSSQNEYEVNFKDGIILGLGDNDGFDELEEFEDIDKVVISFESGDIKLIGTDERGQDIVINDEYPNANCIMPYDYEDDGIVNFENKNYRGGIMFNALSGDLAVINYLPLEEYLYGVVNGELNHSNPIEALKAQAVAARGYAICNLGTHKQYGFDLCSTTHCQVYKGYDDEYEETTMAVDETEGETVKFQGETVTAFFYKNSGGYTQSVEDVWGSKGIGYLKAVKDEYSPIYPWNYTYSFSDLSNKLNSAGHNVGTINNISITKRNLSGAVEELQFTGSNGSTILKKSSIRNVLGASLIKSTMFNFSDGSIVAEPNTQDDENKKVETYLLSNSQSVHAEGTEDFYVMNSIGITKESNSKEIYIYDGKETKAISNLNQSTNNSSEEQQSTDLVESVSGDSVTFNGLGYGHGIGLPQDSAVEMAKKGFTYEDILKYYYTDITID